MSDYWRDVAQDLAEALRGALDIIGELNPTTDEADQVDHGERLLARLPYDEAGSASSQNYIDTGVRLLVDPSLPEAIVTIVEAGMIDPAVEEEKWGDERLHLGDLLIACPRRGCDAVNDLQEIDQSLVYNPAHVEGSLVVVSQEDTHRETIGWRCGSCGEEFDLPALGTYLDEGTERMMLDDLYDVSWT